MRAIHIANEKKRDAEVAFSAAPKPPAVNMALPDGREKVNVKFIKTLSAMEKLKEKYKDNVKIGQAIIDGDPEIDMEQVGRFAKKTLRMWMTSDNEIAYRLNFVEVVYNSDGSEKERRDVSRKQSNIRIEDPVKWTGKTILREEALRKFVFTKSYQLFHTSGLSFDFLFDMAKQLHDSKSFMRLGGGKKGNEQLCLSEGGERYFGFLEGRIKGDTYCLILRLTNMELKPLPKKDLQAGEGE